MAHLQNRHFSLFPSAEGVSNHCDDLSMQVTPLSPSGSYETAPPPVDEQNGTRDAGPPSTPTEGAAAARANPSSPSASPRFSLKRDDLLSASRIEAQKNGGSVSSRPAEKPLGQRGVAAAGFMEVALMPDAERQQLMHEQRDRESAACGGRCYWCVLPRDSLPTPLDRSRGRAPPRSMP